MPTKKSAWAAVGSRKAHRFPSTTRSCIRWKKRLPRTCGPNWSRHPAPHRSGLPTRSGNATRRVERSARPSRTEERHDTQSWTGWFDGSAQPNPGCIGIGGVLRQSGRRLRDQRSGGARRQQRRRISGAHRTAGNCAARGRARRVDLRRQPRGDRRPAGGG